MPKHKEPVIVQAVISAMPRSFLDPMPKVTVVYDNDTKEELFEYYPDEISFVNTEFIGLTRDQAIRLKFTKDKNYLQS